MYKLKLHKTLTTARWRSFGAARQILMIANEVNRFINGIKAHLSAADLRSCMERTFELIDLTVECQKGSLRRELLRWRKLFAEFYPEIEKGSFKTGMLKKLYNVLLLLNSKSAELIL